MKEPVRKIVTTAELKQLLAEGKKVVVPGVTVNPEHAGSYDQDMLDNAAPARQVAAVEYVGVEEVQCISVDHERHLYITDDLIPTHNTSNIIFLKSTDESMLETLQKMSGTRHKVYRDSKTISKDVDKLALRTDGKVSYTMSVKEEPVISYNDMAKLAERNSIVFRAGDSPIWNRNETILPMSWKLFGGSADKTIVHHGHDYSLQTIPTLSSALEFDVRLNQPNFTEMLGKRMSQASKSPTADDIYRKAYGHDDFEVSLLDPDVYASEVMDIIDTMMAREEHVSSGEDGESFDYDDLPASRDMFEMSPEEALAAVDAGDLSAAAASEASAQRVDEAAKVRARQLSEDAVDNETFAMGLSQAEGIQQELRQMRYAESTVSREMLIDEMGRLLQSTLENELAAAYEECVHAFAQDLDYHVDNDGGLWNADHTVTYVRPRNQGEELAAAGQAAADPESRTYVEDEDGLVDQELSAANRYEITKAFRSYLVALEDWKEIAGGHFDAEVARQMRSRDNISLAGR